MRCLSLARVLAGRGWRAGFVAAAPGLRLLEAFGWEGEAIAVPLTELPKAQVVVLDSYRLDVSVEAALKTDGRKVVVMDDLANRAHRCDLLVDPSFGRRADDYAKLAGGAEFLAGPAYALLRPGFASSRQAALSRRDGRTVGRALVSLGLTDLGGITETVVTALLPELGEVELDVVLGESARSLEPLRRLAERDGRIHLHVNTTRVEALMCEADVAVGAGGSSTWERACLGLPSISLVIAENQRELAQQLSGAGAVLSVQAEKGAFGPRLLSEWRRLLGDGDLRVRLARSSAGLCDGLGAERVADAVEALAAAQTPSSGSAGS